MRDTSQTKAVVVVLSGGQDSTTCLFWAKEYFEGAAIHAITFDYGQRHSREINAAVRVAEMAGCATHEVVTLGPDVLAGTSPLVDRTKDLEQYKDWKSLPGGLEKTFVPARNALFLTLAANRAYCYGTNAVVTGVCEEDFGGYPDCRRSFIDKLEKALSEGLEHFIDIYTPLMSESKESTVRMAYEMPDCWEALAYTHTSYDGQFPPVGKDHATLLRAKGFEQAELPDPLIVRAVAMGLMPFPETANYDKLRHEVKTNGPLWKEAVKRYGKNAA